MERPYTFVFGKGYGTHYDSVKQMPKRCNFPLAFATSGEYFEGVDGSTLMRQEFIYPPFFIDLVEVHVVNEEVLIFDIHEKQLFLFFMLVGSATYYDSKGRYITDVAQDHFLMSYWKADRYSASMDKGKHIALVVAIEPEWLETVGSEYQNIYRIVSEFKNGPHPYRTMYQAKIDRTVHRWLRKVYQSQKEDIGIFDGFLRMYMTTMLRHYDTVLERAEEELSLRVKSYLESHYHEPSLSVQSVAAHFHVTPRTLHNHFKKDYGISIRMFYNRLRVERALLLIQEEGLSLKDIYLLVGYADESSLRHAIRRHQKGD